MDWLFVAIVGFVLGMVVQCLAFDLVNGPVVTQDAAIRHGYAYYHPETAQFTWK
jgi:hypothetical protein